MSETVEVLDIVERQKPFHLAPASPDDFLVRPVGYADPSLLVADPTISLYCLDHAGRRALFVQVPEEVDLRDAAFMYMTQYERAQRVLAVPYHVLHDAAARADIDDPLVFIHSTGRAGSTLMSRAFAQMGAVTSLSEPDVYTQAVSMRLDGTPDSEIQPLLASATRVLFNPVFTQDSQLNVIKFRSFCIEVGDLLSRSFPEARNLFLYRDLAPYIRSAHRAFGLEEMPREEFRNAAAALATMTPLLAQELRHRDDLDGVEILALLWLSAMQGFARLRDAGIPILAVRYEELVSDQSEVLEAIVGFAGLPEDRIQQGLRAFERDSQEGTPLSREEASRHTGEIDGHQWELVQELVRRYTVAGDQIPAESVRIG